MMYGDSIEPIPVHRPSGIFMLAHPHWTFMTQLDLGITLPSTELPDPDENGALNIARHAEDCGFEHLWTGELWGSNPFLRLFNVLNQTDIPNVGLGIINIFSRSPATIAMGAATMSRLSDGEITLGLGAGNPEVVTGLHGQSFDRPVHRLAEGGTIIQELLGGDGSVKFEGEIFSIDGYPPLNCDIPIYNAALGQRNLQVTGRIYDGWIPHLIPFSSLSEQFDTIDAATKEAGRDSSEITIAPYIPTMVKRDSESAKRDVKEYIAYYIGSANAFESTVATRYPEKASRISTAFDNGTLADAVGEVTDSMMEDLAIAGTPGEARSQFETITTEFKMDMPILVPPMSTNVDEVKLILTTLGNA
jgi:alkanesulfonate monooxygenase SsuD/methylene tetrahydromethanopterin reductase-like flavin-dependent oxidoreductase (luciferase family)